MKEKKKDSPETTTEARTLSIQEQYDAAVAEQAALAVQRDQLADALAEKRGEVEALALRAANGDEIARKRTKDLRATIAEVVSDSETVSVALAQTTDRVNELSSALNAQIVAEQNAAAAAAVEQLLAQICEADAAFFSAIRTTAAAFGTLRQYRDRLRAGELRQACSATRALERLSAAHNNELEATLRALGGPSIVTADADAAWRLSRAAAVWSQAVLTEWLPLLQKNAL